MKKTKKTSVNMLKALLAFSAVACLVACGGSKEPTQQTTQTPTNTATTAPVNEVKNAVVTFDLNYEGASAATKVEAEDEVVEEPTDPTRARYEFLGWYTTKECTKKFDFEEAIEADVTVYAGWKKVEAAVTFNENYEGGKTTEVTVAINNAVSSIAQPTRTGFNFDSWYSDAACTTVYDFATLVTEDMTLYAKWTEKNANDVELKFHINYEGGNDETRVVTKGRKLGASSIPKPTRDGYYFDGWYTDATLSAKANFNSTWSEDADLYARWLKGTTFEAEYTDLTGVVGSTYSGGGGGLSMIKKDNGKNILGASNGYYVNDMYQFGSCLTFVITSDKAVDDAVLSLRLGGEYFDIILTDAEFTVAVNGTALSYGGVSITNVPEYTTNTKKEFANFDLTTTPIHLNQGENTITLKVTNSTKMQESGTLNATAPMVDAIIVYTDATLTWTPLESNLEGK